MHNVHVVDGINKDLTDKYPNREAYLELAGDWKDPFGIPTVRPAAGFNIVRDDMIGFGSKGRFADLYVNRVKSDHFIYVAPRCGFAAVSLAKTCQKYGKKLTLFAPAAKEPSDHQLTAMELGAEMKWVRIAAMPVLNSYAKQYAEAVGATFIPLGLKDPLVTAAITKTCDAITKVHGEPTEVWSAISTGVLSRGLQIGWPNARFYAVAVARNLKAGELGRATVISYPKPFADACKMEPLFPSVKTYDLKAFEVMTEHGTPGAFFWNVAGEITPMHPERRKEVKSAREWGDKTDMEVA